MDTGSSVLLLPAHVYDNSFSHIPLGQLDIYALHDGCYVPASYIAESGSLLLGLDLTEALEMVIVGNSVA